MKMTATAIPGVVRHQAIATPAARRTARKRSRPASAAPPNALASDAAASMIAAATSRLRRSASPGTFHAMPTATAVATARMTAGVHESAEVPKKIGIGAALWKLGPEADGKRDHEHPAWLARERVGARERQRRHEEPGRRRVSYRREDVAAGPEERGGGGRRVGEERDADGDERHGQGRRKERVGGVTIATPREHDVQGEERSAGREEDGTVLVPAQRVPAEHDVEGTDRHERRPGEARRPKPAKVDPAHGEEFNRARRFPAAVGDDLGRARGPPQVESLRPRW